MIQTKNMKFLKKYIYLTITVIFMCFLGFSKVEASNVYGNAWSEGVGWISFNSCISPNSCSTSSVPSHGVTLDPGTNQVSGTAWNKNIGIISFNPSDWGTCPPDSGSCNLGTFTNKWADGGWARAISVVDGAYLKNNTGGWDGWISLGNSSIYGASIDFSAYVDMLNTDFPSHTFTVNDVHNSYWWGGDVIGWIDLRPSGGSPYDITNGGVFITELDSNLVLYGPSYITAGNSATFTWEALNGFTPTQCTRMSSGSTNWDEALYIVNATSGTIYDIQVPHDNNTQGMQTDYTLECTDGSVTYQAVWSVIVNKFAPEVYFPYSCIAKAYTPTLEIQNLGDADNYSCDVYANDDNDPNRFVGTTNSSSIDDSGWNDINTDYTLQCTNGSTNQASYQSPSATSVQVCSPFFGVHGDTRCSTTQTNEKYGDELILSGGDYVANVVLTLNNFFGFDEDVDISSPDSNVSFSSNQFTSSGGSYNTITATYTISEANYITATNDGEDPIVVPINLDPNSRASLSLNFCPSGSGFIKYRPVYKPF